AILERFAKAAETQQPGPPRAGGREDHCRSRPGIWLSLLGDVSGDWFMIVNSLGQMPPKTVHDHGIPSLTQQAGRAQGWSPASGMPLEGADADEFVRIS